MKGKKSAVILNIIIVILTLNMLVLTYMHAARSIFPSQNNTPVFDNLWIVQNYDESAFAKFDASLCLPDTIVYKQYKGAPSGVYNNPELAQTVYGVLSDVILDIFGNNSIISTENNLSYSDAVELVLSSDSYIIFEYSSELPYPFIYAFSSGQTSVRSDMCSDSNSAYISRIALIIHENDNGILEYECYCFDDGRNVYKFEYSDKTPYILSDADSAHLYAYSSDFKNVSFSYHLPASFDILVYDGIDIILDGFEYSQISASFRIEDMNLDNQTTVNSLLDVFDINPEKINSYVELDGTTAYIGLADRLVISPDGKLEFNSQNSLSLKKILGFSASDSSGYTMFDMLKATNVLIEKFSSLYPELFGNQAVPKLTSAYKNIVGDPVFEYSYFYNGIRIDSAPAYTFVFSSAGLKELTANAASFTAGSAKSAAIPEKIVYSRINNGNLHKLIPIYSSDSDSLYKITWYGK